MTEEYELATFDRHNLNFDNIALGRLPTNVTTDPSVKALRELTYLPKGIMDPHDLSGYEKRAGKLPSEMIDILNSKKRTYLISETLMQIQFFTK